MRIYRVTIWVNGSIDLLTKSPSPSEYIIMDSIPGPLSLGLKGFSPEISNCFHELFNEKDHRPCYDCYRLLKCWGRVYPNFSKRPQQALTPGDYCERQGIVLAVFIGFAELQTGIAKPKLQHQQQFLGPETQSSKW